MRIEVKVPQLPESVTEATLVNWHKKQGEPVKRDENLIDVETDKVVLELPAPGDGVLVEITRPDGATVTSNDVIGVIDTDAKGDCGSNQFYCFFNTSGSDRKDQGKSTVVFSISKTF